MLEMMRVGEHSAPFTGLTHGLTFATDAEVNELIIRRYRLYEWLTPSDTANKMMLQSTVDMWRDYTNKLYETTQYEYDPILNYDRHEEGTETTARHKGSKSVSTPRTAQTVETDGYGLDSVDGAPYQTVTQHAPTGTDTVEVTDVSESVYDKDVLSFSDRRTYGNIGVMTTQEMIQRERDIIIDVLDVYVSKFADCFGLSTHMLAGWLDDDGR